MPSLEIERERTIAEALRRMKLLGANDPNFPALMLESFTSELAITNARFDELHLSDYCIGDGVADDTAQLQQALTDGATQRRVVSGGNLKIRVTGAVSMAGPGLVFNMTSFGNIGDPGIYVTGNGYTALTVSGQPSRMMVSVYGTGNTCNGIYFNNATFMQCQKLRVVGLDGFGVKFERLWDSTILDVSVELCGNATEYAFQVRQGSDTSNMSHFGRVQVEQANRKAMIVDAGTLSCVFHNIHSERATANAADVTWDLSGARTRYAAARFNANNPAAAKLKLGGENVTFANVAAEGAITVECKGASAPMTIETPNWEGTMTVALGGGGGFILVQGGTIATFSSGIDPAIQPALMFNGVRFTTVTVGDCGNPGIPERIIFTGCTIGALTSSSTNSAATLVDCELGDLGSGLQYCLKLVRGKTTVHAGGSTLNGALITDGARIIGNLTTPSTLIASGLTRFEGNLTQSGGTLVSLLGADVLVTGTPTGFSVSPAGGPAVQVQLPGNNWPRGATHWDPVATSVATPGWRCTVAGAPGTWKAMANLA